MIAIVIFGGVGDVSSKRARIRAKVLFYDHYNKPVIPGSNGIAAIL